MKTSDLIEEFTCIIGECIDSQLTGSMTIRINFSQGGISHVEARKEYAISENPTKTVSLNKQ